MSERRRPGKEVQLVASGRLRNEGRNEIPHVRVDVLHCVQIFPTKNLLATLVDAKSGKRASEVCW